MKKVVSRMVAAGGIALLAGAFLPLSSARAQTRDPAAATIECAIGVEETAVRCKEATLKELENCAEESESQSDVNNCDKAAEGNLAKCELTGAAGDIRCQISPTVPNQQ